MRFYDVTDGAVFLDGYDVRQMDFASIYSKIGYIPQQAFLFSGTIADNLRYGKEDATDAELWRALEIAQAKDFVEKLPDGLYSMISQNGTNLSGGQKQKASLVASLVHRPNILFLDEPTIGLDLVVKDNIRKAIKEINEKYKTTVVLTTHDIGDIEELCNRIIIIDHGKIIYDGTLSELKDKYGKKRKVTLAVKDMSVISKGDYAQKFGMKKDSLFIEKDEKGEN